MHRMSEAQAELIFRNFNVSKKRGHGGLFYAMY